MCNVIQLVRNPPSKTLDSWINLLNTLVYESPSSSKKAEDSIRDYHNQYWFVRYLYRKGCEL